VKPKKRQKLCYNCEGEVDLDVIVCPFCAADLREEKPELQRSSFSPSVSSVKQMNTEQSLYPSHYPEPEMAPPRPVEQTLPAIEEQEEPTTIKTLLTPVLLLTSGMHLFMLALALIFLSDHGVLVLKWDAKFWILYLIASLPLLVFGYRSIQNK
jgi:hypothetical protein